MVNWQRGECLITYIVKIKALAWCYLFCKVYDKWKASKRRALWNDLEAVGEDVISSGDWWIFPIQTCTNSDHVSCAFANEFFKVILICTTFKISHKVTKRTRKRSFFLLLST